MSAATDFDAFLDKHDLTRNKTLLVDHEINSTDLVLSLTEPEMKQIGLKLGAIKKIQRAQRQNTEPPVVVHKSEPPPSKTPDGSESAVLPVVRYRPPPLTRGWKCQLGNRDHEVFISYRVFSDEMPAIKLYAALKSSSQYDKNLCPYLDQLCLVDAMNWETGFINGLVNSQVIVLVLSERGLSRTREAHLKPDNQFLEVQHALRRMRESATTGRPVTVQPVYMWSTRIINNQTYASKYFPNPDDFPDEPPCHDLSPLVDGKPVSIRQTIRDVLALQQFNAADGTAVMRLSPYIRVLVAKTERAIAEGILYHQSRPIVLAADEDSQLRVLLDPIDFDPDRKALEDLYVEGTRQWLFDHVTAWADDDDNADRVLWVNAVAGVGKSVAAAQIANILLGRDQLATSLFLKYNDTRKNNPRILLTTIAYGLCRWYAPIGRRLLDAGHSKDDLDKMSIPDLFKAVIEDPLEALGQYRPKGAVVVMVDGLDECHPRDEILSLLAWRLTQLRDESRIKLLLTSRPEADIKAAFRGVPTTTIEASSEDNIRDLRVFIDHRLRDHPSLSESDRTQAISVLLDQSKTFVWINLILNTVEHELETPEPGSTPCEESDAAHEPRTLTLEMIREINDSSVDLKGLYHKTFAKIHSQSSHPAELVTVVSAIATAQSILTPQIIADVFGLEIGVVRECLKSLSLVLDPGANGLGPRGSQSTNTEVKFNHKSVADYLLGDASTGHPWHVSTSFHTVFAKGCLGVILSHEPVINICDIYDFHDNIADLEDRVAATITPSLRYSVAHWITHFVWCVEGVAESSPVWQSAEMVDVAAVLTRFVKTHVFFWLECGSLTHVVKPIIEQLAVLRGVTNMAPSTIVDDTTKELVKDTYRFIREFADPIIKSAPQVYNSGYAFTPKETAIYKTYADRLEDKIPFLVTAGPAPTWDPCEMTLTGHAYRVFSVAISPNGKWIASGSDDNTIKVWDATTGQVKLTLEGHTNIVRSVAISPDGNWIISGSTDKTIKVWDIPTSEVRRTLEGHTDWVSSVAISSDGKSIVSGSGDNTIKVWDAATGQVKLTLEGHTDTVFAVAISPDGKWIVSGSGDDTIKLWDAATGQVKHALEGHTLGVTSVVISPDGKWIASGSEDRTIGVWDSTTGQLKHTLEGHTWNVFSVAISPDGKWIVSGSWDTTIKLWDAATGQVKHALEGHTLGVTSVVISPDGNWIISGSEDRTIRVWDSTTGQVKHTLEGHTHYVLSVAISPDGKWIASSSADKAIKLWDAATGQVKLTLEGHTDTVFAVAISPDGKWIVSGSGDDTIKLWDAATGQVKHALEGHTLGVTSVVISPDGKWIASGSEDRTIGVWDSTTGQLKHTLEGHTNRVTSVAISPDGKWIVSGSSDHTIKLWDAATGQLKHTLEGHTTFVTSVAISPDGNSILSRDGRSNQIIWARRGDEWIRSDKDASSLIAASGSNSLSQWTIIDDSPQWIRHGSHSTKIPHSLFGVWWHRIFTPSGGFVYWTHALPIRLVINLPIYLNTLATRAEVARYIEAKPAITAAFEESRASAAEDARLVDEQARIEEA